MFRIVFLGFLILSVVYICLFFYSRSVRRAKLKEWYEESDKSVDIDTYVDQGLKKYDSSIRPKLLWGVYIVPILVIITIIYTTNYA